MKPLQLLVAGYELRVAGSISAFETIHNWQHETSEFDHLNFLTLVHFSHLRHLI